MAKLATWAALVLAAGPFAGCGKSAPAQIAQATKNVQAAVEQVQETAAQATGISVGSVELSLDTPLRAEKCFATFTPKGISRPGVLQLMTYEDPKAEEFPSVLLWATGDAASAMELIGQTIEGHLFVQREAGRGTWSSSTLRPIAITVVHADPFSVTCEIADAEVVRADGAQSVKASGKFVALWKAAPPPPADAN
jgi:hypothetical protein